MAMRLTRKIQDSRALRLRGDPTVSSLEGLGTRFDVPSFSQDLMKTEELVARELDLSKVPEGFRVPFAERLQAEQSGKKIDAETLNKRYEKLGLKFDGPMTEEGARLLVEEKRAEMIRNSVLRREPGGILQGGAGLGVSLLNAAYDPLEIAAALIPVVGEARQAAWIARFGAVRGRAAVGLVEGSIGNVLTEPAYMGASRALQRDYTYSDALLNVFLGGVLGTTLGVGIGAGARVRAALRRKGIEVPTPETRPGTDLVPAPRQLPPPTRALPAPERVTSERAVALSARERELTDIVERRAERRSVVVRQENEIRQKLEHAKNPKQIKSLEKKLGKLLEERRVLDQDNNATRAEIDRIREEQASLATPSVEARGEALKSAVAQAAQGKQVRTENVIRAIEDRRSVEALHKRDKELQREERRLEKLWHRAKTPETRAKHEAALKPIRAEMRALRRRMVQKIEERQKKLAEVLERTAQDEGKPDRSPLHEPEQVTRLAEESKKPDVPEDDEVAQEIQELQSVLEGEVEAGRLTPEELDKINEELKGIDDKTGAMENAANYMRTCLRR